MKKLLLLAALAASFGMAQAQELEYIREVARITDGLPAAGNARQATVMNGKVYVHDKAEGKVMVFDQNGLTNEEYNSVAGSWPAISHDQAGNLIVRIDATWPAGFAADGLPSFRIFPADGSEPVDVAMPASFFESNCSDRMDFMGDAAGDVMDDEDGGVLFLTTKATGKDGIYALRLYGGQPDEDYSELIPVSLHAEASTFSYVQVYGDAMYYIVRNAQPAEIVEGDEELEVNTFTLPKKGASVGTKPFNLGGYDLFIYSTTPNYGDGFAIAAANAAEPLAEVPEEKANVAGGAGYCTSFGVEPVQGTATKAMVYQYVAGNYIRVYELKIKNDDVTAVKTVNAQKTVTGVKYYNAAGVESATPFTGVNIVVNTYNDGSKQATKVLR